LPPQSARKTIARLSERLEMWERAGRVDGERVSTGKIRSEPAGSWAARVVEVVPSQNSTPAPWRGPHVRVNTAA
jgi:hypothetical protein